MAAEAQRRLGDRASVEIGDLNEYTPPDRVAATTVFRAIYYARDRRAFFARVAAFTEKKLVFDLNPRQYRRRRRVGRPTSRRLRSGVLRPFFVPQTRRAPAVVATGAKALERSGPLARLALRARFTYLVAASSQALAAEERLEPHVERRAPSSRRSLLSGIDVVRGRTSARSPPRRATERSAR